MFVELLIYCAKTFNKLVICCLDNVSNLNLEKFKNICCQ